MVIDSHFPSNIEPLNLSVPTRFKNAAFDSLLQEMFLEMVASNNTHFDLFYQQCASIVCSYQVERRREIIIGILLLGTVCGGLKRGLKLGLPLVGSLILFFIKRWRSSTINFDRISEYKQKIYTRVYLILFICILGFLLFYSSITGCILLKTTLNPSIIDYENLLQLRGDDIECPCTRISIPYKAFVTQLNISLYHQVYTLDAIRRTLTTGSIIDGGTAFVNRADFRSGRFEFIKGLDMLCNLAKDSLNHDIEAFLASTILLYQLIPRTQFDSEMNITLDLMKLTTPVAFTRILELFRLTSYGNASIGILSLSWNFLSTDNTQNINTSFLTVSINEYTTCSCATTRSCSMPTQLCFTNGTSYYTFKGLVLDCFLLGTILGSSLSCFYSMICNKEFRKIMDLYWPEDLEKWSNQTGFPAVLDASATRFSINDTIETIAYNMFIES
ncbi:unnamed protein product [Rotaria magnacalcarata]|uniref:Uncharacterized protein n=1 Tax=Rotaria magnacalcarata TaxID=392030 RepID=A0A816LNU8_9BILA|nr:unnamed protein product [Rotaria magnacalcarata]